MQIELQSATMMTGGNSGRPTLTGTIDRGWSARRYQVFGFGKGYLFLDLGRDVSEKDKGRAGAMVGGFLGGAVGSYLGSQLEQGLADDFDAPEVTFEHKSNDELIALARKSKHSFVVPYDEIQWVKVEKAGILASSECVGFVKLKEPSVGRINLAISDFDSMLTAIETFPAKLGDRATVKVKLNESTLKFVKA